MVDFSMNLQSLALDLFPPEARFPINHDAVQSNRVVSHCSVPCLQPSASVVLSWFAWEVILRP